MKEKPRVPFLAAILSLAASGLGQLYNGQFVKGIVFLLAVLLIPSAPAVAGLPGRFAGYVVFAVVSVGLWLLVAVEAFLAAKKKKGYALKGYNRGFVYLPIVVISIGGAVFAGRPLAKFAGNVLGFGPYKFVTGSMEPTLMPGDHVMADLRYFKKNAPRRGDLVIFRDPKDPSRDFVKRAVAFGGDKVEIKQGRVFVDDEAVLESLFPGKSAGAEPGPTDPFGPVVVPSGSFFVLGDNLDNSVDSRIWGALTLDGIKGKPLYVYWAKDKRRIGTELK